MKRLWAVAVAIMVTGCSAPALKGANERGGTVTHAIGSQQPTASEIANAHCKKYGRVARVSGTDVFGNTMTFECVLP
jgi:hypothetical protein